MVSITRTPGGVISPILRQAQDEGNLRKCILRQARDGALYTSAVPASPPALILSLSKDEPLGRPLPMGRPAIRNCRKQMLARAMATPKRILRQAQDEECVERKPCAARRPDPLAMTAWGPGRKVNHRDTETQRIIPLRTSALLCALCGKISDRGGRRGPQRVRREPGLPQRLCASVSLWFNSRLCRAVWFDELAK